MMFFRLSVRLSGTGMNCDHTVHFSADLILWLDSPMLYATLTAKHVHLSPAVFLQFQLEDRWDIDKCQPGVISEERLNRG